MAKRRLAVSPGIDESRRPVYSIFEHGSDVGFTFPEGYGDYRTERQAYEAIEQLAQQREAEGHEVVNTRRRGLFG